MKAAFFALATGLFASSAALAAPTTTLGYPANVVTSATGNVSFELACQATPSPTIQWQRKVSSALRDTQRGLDIVESRMRLGFARLSCEIDALRDPTGPSCAQPVPAEPLYPSPVDPVCTSPGRTTVIVRGAGAPLALQMALQALETETRVRVTGEVRMTDPYSSEIIADTVSLP